MSEPVVAGVELGGTKVCVVVGRAGEILEQVRIPTGAPGETLANAAGHLARMSATWRPATLGIGSFGPIALDKRDPAFGRMLKTPKPGWSGVDILAALGGEFPGRVAIQTDVAVAALAEGAHGAAQGLDDFVYMTIGTGIGIGVIASGRPVAGFLHPEGGHLRVRRVAGDSFKGACAFHGDCLEGLASGTAIASRTGRSADVISDDDPSWIFVADAIAEACSTLFLTLATQRLIFGGGVGVGQPHLLPAIQRLTVEKLGGYLPQLESRQAGERMVLAALGQDAGPLGVLQLAHRLAAVDGPSKGTIDT